MAARIPRAASTSVAITDPLVKYQALIATGLYQPDPAQHRLALHLHKIYNRLNDYSPSVEYRARLRAVSDALDRLNKEQASQDNSRSLAERSHPIRGNPLFANFFQRTEGGRGTRDSLALTRVLTSHEEAIQIDSPRGLFLSGEVGTGKSMLLDLLADGLPTSRKRRWHFNTFMLYTLSQLEQYRKAHAGLDMDGGDGPQPYSLLWVAKDMIEKSPILFLDEFQLPDRAASKILSNLFTIFFQLGGVLVASSNRMPEELEKATGFEYTAPASSTLKRMRKALGMSPAVRKGRGESFGAASDFANFLEVLKARCEFWQMEGARDWRRREMDDPDATRTSERQPETLVGGADPLHSADTSADLLKTTLSNPSTVMPTSYYLNDHGSRPLWDKAVRDTASQSDTTLGDAPIDWKPLTLAVYGRTVHVPRQHNGVVYWDFADLVSTYGPADYITMSSTFHTFIIDGIPVLTMLKKNEARRLITLLDAMYEARCKLLVRAAAGPDDLFFPDSSSKNKSSTTTAIPSGESSDQGSLSSLGSAAAEKVVTDDAIYSETIAEVFQDQMSPFRPNISTYTDGGGSAAYDPDQDSDFHSDPSHPSRFVGGRPDVGGPVDFSNTSAFTGEDERFAYKRAASRLWELCSAQWHARDEDGWWRPLPKEARHWEGRPLSKPIGGGSGSDSRLFPKRVTHGDVTMGAAVELDEPAGLERHRVEELQKEAAAQGGGGGQGP